MAKMMHKNKSVDVHHFAMIPSADIPRSSFRMQSAHKTTFDAGYLVPIFCTEVLPGDTFRLNMTAFARLATPLLPVMDNLHLDTFWFYVPYRLLWDNWKKFMGEQTNPGDSISFTIPQMVSPASGYAINSLHDYFGLPTVGQVTGGATVSHSSLPLRAYNRIYDEWFRDENLVNSTQRDTGNGPDTYSNYTLRRRGKRHDYFTSALPWPQKGNTAVSLPLGTSAPIKYGPTISGATTHIDQYVDVAYDAGGVAKLKYATATGIGATGQIPNNTDANLYADLNAATAATINQLRQSFQIQKLLERDARGGTRYTEIIRAHFGVISPDARLQRPEYLGGNSTPIIVNPIPQTSATGLTGGTTAQGDLAAVATGLGRSGFTQSFTEHGIIIGLAEVRADLSYQQGLERFWSRTTRYDFYFPAFAMLGEQSILNKEIYSVGSATGGITAGDQDMAVFGYQERWAEYRYLPAKITGLFRSTAASTIDPWHLAQKFTSLPTLNQTFIEDTPPLSRVLAIGSSANGKQLIFDSFFDITATRPMPMYSVPGLIDHF